MSLVDFTSTVVCLVRAKANDKIALTRCRHPTGLSQMRLTEPDAGYIIVVAARAVSKAQLPMVLRNLTNLAFAFTFDS